ncbi:hypothetical protein GCM10007047_16470 [Cerasicoccus arenae]|uniref:DUF192 domain-containing protein n=2 Tax=Cerasicoccus arenae TaxID=424488 RepID=A0A8J3GE49_9BACT|nr:hypothetical protein GCM10007047_16470 [Cerasicoccus arenae]
MTIGDQQIRVQLAIKQEEQQRGLMFRQTLAENDGMLFIFSRPESRSFWMRNVDLPLDVGYINPEGVLREVYPMYPHDENSVPSRGSDIQYVLEMNQDWYQEHKVFPGAKIDIALIADAMKDRGFNPAQFGMPDQ